MQKLKLVLNDQGGAVMSWNYDCIVSTLRREMKHHEPMALIEEEDGDSGRSLQPDHDGRCDPHHIPCVIENDDDQPEPIVFRDDITIKVDEDGVAFTLGARDFKGVQCVVQNVTGTLSPGAHAGSYNGQDAYNDMLVVEDGKRICFSGVRSIQGVTGGVNAETEGLQRCDRYYSEGGANE